VLQFGRQPFGLFEYLFCRTHKPMLSCLQPLNNL
jgi:hypothetical protein